MYFMNCDVSEATGRKQGSKLHMLKKGNNQNACVFILVLTKMQVTAL